MKKAVAISVFLFLAVASFVGWDMLQREAKLREQIRQMQEVVTRLNAEYRVAQVRVVGQGIGENGEPATSLEFCEIGRDNQPLVALPATLMGKENYFEALVVKFRNDYVEKGDALRGKSVILFRRMWGSATAPDSGVLIDPNASDGIPNVYRVSADPTGVERQLWERFWYYANNPREADKLGVRVLQLEAVGIRPLPGMIYELTVENDGGINIIPITAMPK